MDPRVKRCTASRHPRKLRGLTAWLFGAGALSLAHIVGCGADADSTPILDSDPSAAVDEETDTTAESGQDHTPSADYLCTEDTCIIGFYGAVRKPVPCTDFCRSFADTVNWPCNPPKGAYYCECNTWKPDACLPRTSTTAPNYCSEYTCLVDFFDPPDTCESYCEKSQYGSTGPDGGKGVNYPCTADSYPNQACTCDSGYEFMTAACTSLGTAKSFCSPFNCMVSETQSCAEWCPPQLPHATKNCTGAYAGSHCKCAGAFGQHNFCLSGAAP